jgi:hypothetical protein
LEIGIKPTVRHAADLGIVPDSRCRRLRAGNEEAGQRTLDQLGFVADALMTNEAAFCAALTVAPFGTSLSPGIGPGAVCPGLSRSPQIRQLDGDALRAPIWLLI